MGNRYLVVSDLHLADIEDHPDGWRAHKASNYLFDDDFVELVEHFSENRSYPEQGGLTLVLNGDIFDFDLVTAIPEAPPWPLRPDERWRGLDPTEDKSVWKLRRMLVDHPHFLEGLARFLARGNRLVYVLGNHDREFHFPAVQRTFVEALQATSSGLALGPWQPERLIFEPWFFLVPGEVYIEHGQQYDHYSSFHDVLDPLVDGRTGPEIALPMGNLSNRYLISKMGFFNPHATDFILNVYHYLYHWGKHYAFSSRSLVLSWFFGSFRVMSKLLSSHQKLFRKRLDPERHLEGVATRYDLTLQAIKALYRLQLPPITTRFYRIIREFWIDRLVIVLGMALGTVALLLLSVPWWVKVMVPLTVFPLVYLIYEALAQGETVFVIEKHFPRVARAIARLLPVQVISFGHTHVPRLLPLSRRAVFVDTGTWAPLTAGEGPHPPLLPGKRNYLYAAFLEEGLRLEFGSWSPPEQQTSATTSRNRMASSVLRELAPLFRRPLLVPADKDEQQQQPPQAAPRMAKVPT